MKKTSTVSKSKKRIKTTMEKPKKAANAVKFLADEDLVLVNGGRMMRNLSDTL